MIVGSRFLAGEKVMLADINSVYISVGSVVLDRPDQTGEFIAKDLVGGWAYVIADDDGDKRFRGQGAYAGGLATGLRYAFVSAISCVPKCRRITIYVETMDVHHQMIQLATADAQVVAAIAGRPVFVRTRPGERSLQQVRLAAEQAAIAALRARERIERQETSEPSPPDPVAAGAERVVAAPIVTEEPREDWRKRLSRRSSPGQRAIRATMSRQAAVPDPSPALPEFSDAKTPASPTRPQALMQWLHEFDNRVESVQTGLQSVGC